MARATEAEGAVRAEPLRISRTFPAPREAVFKAWSSAERVKRWFCPAAFTVPDAKVEMRPGGPFEVCMRAPDGTEHWTRGAFAEVTPFERLELDLHVTDAAAAHLFNAYTEVDFVEVPGGTRMDVVQTYTLLAPEAARWSRARPTAGARRSTGSPWRSCGRAAATPRSVAHGVFHLERTYEAPVERVLPRAVRRGGQEPLVRRAAGALHLAGAGLDFRIGGPSG